MDPEDELKAENEVLKLKLELEHGMQQSESKDLSPAVENQWLNYIYNFEKISKEAPRLKVYDFIGRPDFIPIESLQENEAPDALDRLEELMDEKGVALSCICEYAPSVIYRFITVELFEYETNWIVMEGMVHNFIYEEFHPNHDYDIRRLVSEFVEALLTKKWNEQFDGMSLADTISFNDKVYNKPEMTAIITAFQDSHPNGSIETSQIEEVSFDIEKGTGLVKATLAYSDGRVGATGDCLFQVVMEDGYWNIASIEMPGFGDQETRRQTLK